MASLRIEVVYALPAGEDSVALELPPDATALDAVRASGVLERHREIDLERQALGIHGRAVQASRRLADGDRVEIYRPLVVEPKEARRRRVVKR
jgi:putative ubiquitin-RnfH superfamily antitoxin RatB of RatAB toxin-antitoxin module